MVPYASLLTVYTHFVDTGEIPVGRYLINDIVSLSYRFLSS